MIKQKSIIVIFLSSILIALVFVVTLLGFYLYLTISEDDNELQYRESLSELNAKLYEKYIYLSSVVLKVGTKERFRNKPIIEGRISNQSNKTIISIQLGLTLTDNDGRTLYVESFYPLRPDAYLTVIPKRTGSYLAQNDTVSFIHILKRCPADVYAYLKEKHEFAKGEKSDGFNFEYKIKKLIVE
ncbi:MAG: hypothetical protein PHS37_03735 [Candidatus Omnitrophica bacterium]|nr:hypothetical protein [Candidatus Omnitrophota bacterium]